MQNHKENLHNTVDGSEIRTSWYGESPISPIIYEGFELYVRWLGMGFLNHQRFFRNDAAIDKPIKKRKWWIAAMTWTTDRILSFVLVKKCPTNHGNFQPTQVTMGNPQRFLNPLLVGFYRDPYSCWLVKSCLYEYSISWNKSLGKMISSWVSFHRFFSTQHIPLKLAQFMSWKAPKNRCGKKPGSFTLPLGKIQWFLANKVLCWSREISTCSRFSFQTFRSHKIVIP